MPRAFWTVAVTVPSPFAAQASATIGVQPAVTKCDGPKLSCSTSGPTYTAAGPIVLQF